MAQLISFSAGISLPRFHRLSDFEYDWSQLDVTFYVTLVVCLVLVVIVVVALRRLAKRIEANPKLATRIKYLRMVANLVAIVLIVLFFWLRDSGG